MKCPKDNQQLSAKVVSDTEVSACSSCRGMLISSNKLLKQVSSLTGSGSVLKLSDLKCPECSASMQSFTYKGVELDICSNCNLVWLDEGEEKKILGHQCWHWLDAIDPIELINIGPETIISSVDYDAILEFVGEAVSSLLDGL